MQRPPTVLWLFLLIVILLLLWLLFRGGLDDDRPPTRLMNAAGEEALAFQPLDSVFLEANGLEPRQGYRITVSDPDSAIVVENRLSTDGAGRIPAVPLWYHIGAPTCDSVPVTAAPSLEQGVLAYWTDTAFPAGTYSLRFYLGENLVREQTFQVTAELQRPVIYAADARGCPKTGFLIGEEDVWVVGKNLPEHSIVRLWVVDARSDRQEDERFKDRTGQYEEALPPVFELRGERRDFIRRLWPKALTSMGSYDIVAEVVTDAAGVYESKGSAQTLDLVSHATFSGFVMQRRPGATEPLEMDIAGSVESPFAFRSTFLTTEDVYVGVDPTVQPAYVGQTADVYIVQDKTAGGWVSGNSLVDVTGTVEQITVGGICGNCWKTLAWSAPLAVGNYDVVLDFDQDGNYTNGVDLIDGLDAVGFIVAEMRVDTIEFNYGGSGAITIFDDTQGSIVAAPEYISAGNTVKPAAWVKGGSHSVRASFKAVPSVNSAQVWAEGGLGGLAGSATPMTVSFSGGAGQALFGVNTLPAAVARTRFQWNWKYKNLNGNPSSTVNMGSTGEHLLYSTIAAPTAPQGQPWLQALDIASDVAHGATTAGDAAREIWDDFYNHAGGQYDTTSGSPRYTSSTNQSFNLTSWLSNYQGGGIGTVNCYDMGKAVAVFANALGCNAVYTYVGPFGFLNAVKPIGRGWANNPFYDNSAYNSSPMVPEDWGWADGRSSFGNHGFTRVGGQICDGSGGQVDIDGNPDAAPHVAHPLNGQDSWTSQYRNRVIDDVPASTPGTPTDYSFSVH